MSDSIYDLAKMTARNLRKRQTIAEEILWTILRNRGFLGKKFYRQYPIVFEYLSRKKFYVADFYCHENKLIIEVDGKNHDYQKEYDKLRSYIINELGIRVVRFKNEEIESEIEKVLGGLKRLLQE